MTIRRFLPPVLFLLSTTLALSCASTSKDSGGTAGGGSSGSRSGGGTLADAVAAGGAGASVGAVSFSDNGLEVKMWIVGDDPAVVGPAFTSLGEPLSLPPPRLERLRENGFRMARVPLVNLPELRRLLGGASIDQKWWFGQVFEWREVFRRGMGGETRGVAVDGRVRPFGGGEFTLLIRAWTTKTEDGPRLQFDLVPAFTRNEGAPIRRLLDEKPGVEAFGLLHVGLRLEPGYAYVITGESPGADWTRLTSERSNPDRVTPPSGGGVRGSVGPMDVFGPDSAGPATIGETLLRGNEPVSNRLVIVFIPHIPATLYPPELAPWNTPGDGGDDAVEPSSPQTGAAP